jgi:hypothetical protein
MCKKLKKFTAEVLEMSQKWVMKLRFFICVLRLDSSYALKSKNSGSDAMRLFTRDYGTLIFLIFQKEHF